MSEESPNKPRVYKNLWAKESPANTVKHPLCDCLKPQYDNSNWSELQIHQEEQDTNCSGWQRLNALIDEAIRDGRERFSPGPEMTPQEWAEITILPASIAKLKSVKHFILYGSSLVRVPPEIGEMTSLEEFTPYTSYRLHWFPYEILRCKNLKKSTISTRALYGNYKYRAPFPKLPQLHPTYQPDRCSVCNMLLQNDTLKQLWISLPIGTDVVPLLVHACSNECIANLPAPPKGYVQTPHTGGLNLMQPDADR